MSESSLLINNVNSPVARSAIVSPIAAGAGHVAAETAAGLVDGQGFKDSFINSFDGIGQSMAIGGAIGVASTIGSCYANKISPWTGFNNSSNHSIKSLRELGIFSTQKGINKEMAEFYLSQMRNGSFNNFRVSIMKHNNNLYITDGHSRMTATFNYYLETGSSFYIDALLIHARYDYVNPSDYGYSKTNLWK